MMLIKEAHYSTLLSPVLFQKVALSLLFIVIFGCAFNRAPIDNPSSKHYCSHLPTGGECSNFSGDFSEVHLPFCLLFVFTVATTVSLCAAM